MVQQGRFRATDMMTHHPQALPHPQLLPWLHDRKQPWTKLERSISNTRAKNSSASALPDTACAAYAAATPSAWDDTEKQKPSRTHGAG